MAKVAVACVLLCGVDGYAQDGFNVPPGFDPTPLRSQAAPVFRGMGDDVEQWRPLVAGHFSDLGPDVVETVLCLMERESGGNPDARNPSSGASGLMQVLPSWAPQFGLEPADLFTPEINLYVSRRLYDDGGFHHWSPYQRGECR